jgi:soluble lytic murein transglycosylase-like protein
MCSARRILLAAVRIAVLLSAVGRAWAGDDIFERAAADGSVQLSNVPDSPDYQLVLAAPRAPVAAAPAATDTLVPMPARAARYRDVVAQAAKQAKVDVHLVHAVIAVESGYNPGAVSRKGAIGLMQLMPETARRYGAGDGRDPARNVRAGALYLADLLKLFGNDLHLALAAYNAGEQAVLRYGHVPPYPETVSYVPKVLAEYRRMKTLSI